MKTQQLAKAFNRNVKTLDERAERFLGASDPINTQGLRKATARLATSHSLLPRSLRKAPRMSRYFRASRKLSKATGKIRDIDTIATWASQVKDQGDKRAFVSDLARTREGSLKAAVKEAKEIAKLKSPSIEPEDLSASRVDRRVTKVESRISKKVDKEFEEFLLTQEVEVMHSLRKDSKKLRHLLELTRNGGAPPLLERLRSIQDDLGAIRDHDLVIDYLRSRIKLTSSPSLIREEIAKRHARLEDFVTKNRGQGLIVPVAPKVRAS